MSTNILAKLSHEVGKRVNKHGEIDITQLQTRNSINKDAIRGGREVDPDHNYI